MPAPCENATELKFTQVLTSHKIPLPFMNDHCKPLRAWSSSRLSTGLQAWLQPALPCLIEDLSHVCNQNPKIRFAGSHGKSLEMVSDDFRACLLAGTHVCIHVWSHVVHDRAGCDDQPLSTAQPERCPISCCSPLGTSPITMIIIKVVAGCRAVLTGTRHRNVRVPRPPFSYLEMHLQLSSTSNWRAAALA